MKYQRIQILQSREAKLFQKQEWGSQVPQNWALLRMNEIEKKEIHVKMKLEEMKKLKSYYYWIFISWSWSKRPKSLFEVLSIVNLCYFPELFYKKHFCDQCFRKLWTASYFSWIIGEWSEMNYPDTSRSVARSTVCIKWIIRLSSYLACILIMFNDVKRRYKLSK